MAKAETRRAWWHLACDQRLYQRHIRGRQLQPEWQRTLCPSQSVGGNRRAGERPVGWTRLWSLGRYFEHRRNGRRRLRRRYHGTFRLRLRFECKRQWSRVPRHGLFHDWIHRRRRRSSDEPQRCRRRLQQSRRTGSDPPGALRLRRQPSLLGRRSRESLRQRLHHFGWSQHVRREVAGWTYRLALSGRKPGELVRGFWQREISCRTSLGG